MTARSRTRSATRGGAARLWCALASLAMCVGCAAEQATSPDVAPLPRPSDAHVQRVSVAAHDHWNNLQDSAVEIAYVQLFTSEPGDVEDMIIRVTGHLGDGSEVASDTICWVASQPDETPRYETAAIITREPFADATSEDVVITRSYWPVDANGDGVDDLLVLGWVEGPSLNKPAELRLITRGRTEDAWRGIAVDETLAWRDLPVPRVMLTTMFMQAAAANTDAVWGKRLSHCVAEMMVMNRADDDSDSTRKPSAGSGSDHDHTGPELPGL